jgi:UDP-2,4-diacetamido-2,4,6-trideoxy-beta-L-altropyranose hydrolase
VNVAIRVDASLDIGTGHVMRCLALASRLRERGAQSLFLCGDTAGNLCDLIQELGFGAARLPAYRLPADWQRDADGTCSAIGSRGLVPDLLVVDHYGLDARWERALHPLVGRIFVIDDLANRFHDCDVLLDQNLHDFPDSRYLALVKPGTRVFVGPRFALMRSEFDNAAVRLRDQGLRRLLIFFGGTDPTNEAQKLISALRTLGTDSPDAMLVLGPVNPHAAGVERSAAGLTKIEIFKSTSRMAELMSEADLGVGTCGASAWERCSLGLPALVVVNAENQRDDARILHALGAVRNLGCSVDAKIDDWVAALRALQQDPMALLAMSRASAHVMQGREDAWQELEATLAS